MSSNREERSVNVARKAKAQRRQLRQFQKTLEWCRERNANLERDNFQLRTRNYELQREVHRYQYRQWQTLTWWGRLWWKPTDK